MAPVEENPDHPRLEPATTPPSATFALQAPMRLTRSFATPWPRPFARSTMAWVRPPCAPSPGVFVPLEEFGRRGVQPSLAMRALTEANLLVKPNRNGPPTLSREFNGNPTVGIVLDPRCVSGLDLAGFAAPPAGKLRCWYAATRCPGAGPTRSMPASPGGWRCSISSGRRHGAFPRQLALPLALVCFAMGVLRVPRPAHAGLARFLGGRGIEVVGTDDLARWCQDPASVFLGFGFEWRPVHSQRLYELAKIDYREFAVSPRLLQLLGYDSKPQPDAEIGLPYIHGVEPKEGPLHRPLQNFEGRHAAGRHHPVRQGRGAGQPDHPGDPARRRGDRHRPEEQPAALKRVVERACADYREPDTFLEFHPAFPERGYGWTSPSTGRSPPRSPRVSSPSCRRTPPAPSRPSAGMPSMSWCRAWSRSKERPNLMKLTKYIEGRHRAGSGNSLRRYYDQTLGAGWRELPEMKKLLTTPGAAT